MHVCMNRCVTYPYAHMCTQMFDRDGDIRLFMVTFIGIESPHFINGIVYAIR